MELGQSGQAARKQVSNQEPVKSRTASAFVALVPNKDADTRDGVPTILEAEIRLIRSQNPEA